MPRRTCALPHCDLSVPPTGGFCKGHWDLIPEDLQERWRWALQDSGDPTDRDSTLHAIQEELDR